MKHIILLILFTQIFLKSYNIRMWIAIFTYLIVFFMKIPLLCMQCLNRINGF